MTAALAARSCPLCGQEPDAVPGAPRRALVARHADRCAVGVEEVRQAAADRIALIGRAEKLRALTGGERLALGVLWTGRPIPVAVAARLQVRLVALGGGAVLRTVEDGGAVWTVEVISDAAPGG